jgi:lipoic acid synthetase
LPVSRYVSPDGFKMFEDAAREMGFAGAACGPMVRSSYWAEKQARDTLGR